MGCMAPDDKKRAPRNRTQSISAAEIERLRSTIIVDRPPHPYPESIEGTINGDYRDWIELLPSAHVDLLFLDPPYNLTKNFNGRQFTRSSVDDYTAWISDALGSMVRLLKPNATVYICGDWLSSQSIYAAATKYFTIRNRITWEREKGRGAKANWKNSSEDIWFCTVSDAYTFNVDAVKLRRKVIAPYTDKAGNPKDWTIGENGGFRDTHPSNIWTDITIPFWSMPENTDHPTQKSEKLLAKLILASTNPGDFVFDPFLGSGTTSVVAKKLGRRYLGIEIDTEYALLAAKRLEAAESNRQIQGLTDGVFWERNSLSLQREPIRSEKTGLLF